MDTKVSVSIVSYFRYFIISWGWDCLNMEENKIMVRERFLNKWLLVRLQSVLEITKSRVFQVMNEEICIFAEVVLVKLYSWCQDWWEYLSRQA